MRGLAAIAVAINSCFNSVFKKGKICLSSQGLLRIVKEILITIAASLKRLCLAKP